jgi:hypothetical protein
LLRLTGLAASQRKPTPQTTDSAHELPLAPIGRKRQFTATAPNQGWVGDMTYVATGEGWVYVATLLDLSSRRCGMGAECSSRCSLGDGGVCDGIAAAPPEGRPVTPLRSGQSLYPSGISPPAGNQRAPSQHEPPRHLLGQRGGRKLLENAQKRVYGPFAFPHPAPGTNHALCVGGGLLQPSTPSLDPGLCESARIRAIAHTTSILL